MLKPDASADIPRFEKNSMSSSTSDFEDYTFHLKQISLLGRIYKKAFLSPVIYWNARRYGPRVIEVGCGTGSGVLGAYSRRVSGLDINPHSIAFCQAAGLDAKLIEADGTFPVADGVFDACILDNVLEHIENPIATLDECFRITSERGGLVIAVPGTRGYASDTDHKRFYGPAELLQLDTRWQLTRLFSAPFFLTSDVLSRAVKQYCLVAVYQKTLVSR